MKNNNHLRSKLRNVRGLGSAKGGVHHWWLERITALALVPLGLWFMYSLVEAMLFPTATDVANWLSSPFPALFLIILIMAGFIHIALGNQVIIEDYIKCPYQKYTLIIGNKFLCFSLAVVSVMAVLKMHFMDIASASF